MRKYKLLLVDDDPFILTGIGKDLENEGFEVLTAQSGEQAVALVEEQRFDLVITDLVLGGIGGIEVLRAAKTRSGETMVIILTGYGDMGSAIEALRLDADDYLLKPCEPEETKFRIARCLEQIEMRRRLRVYEKMLPICCVCKKIRDDAGKAPGSGGWISIEKYVWERAGVLPTSTYCPACVQEAKKELDKL
jgi:DNA-binding response OmpR family regulator